MELPIIAPAVPASVGGCSAKRCGTAPSAVAGLPESIRLKVQDHPCYSEQAHHHFARMHVAVAPACNIQCNYCNRKYDCANESRPGVVSEVLSVDEAVAKTLAVAAAIPQMTVLGIAGPGDALANPARTFETFRRVSALAPDIKLCLSTNGLMLPEFVDEIARHAIDHVTVTINCIDPEVGAKIYPWIFWQNRRIQGIEAARILIAQQQKGLEMLTARGVLVKVNSVLIPGVNDAHLPEVSRAVRARGAFLHNVMPLIAAPEHGTHFGLSGQRSPTPAELQAVQDACGGDMAMMRHCRQCRADAVGLLGEDRGAEFTRDRIAALEIDHAAALARRQEVRAALIGQMDAARAAAAPPMPAPELPPSRPVLMAVAAKNGLVGQHFGHAREFLVYEASAGGVRFVGVRKADLYCGGEADCGGRESTLAATIRALEGCEAVLCAKVGFEPWSRLEAAGIAPDAGHAMEPIEDAVRAVYAEMRAAGKLTAPAGADKPGVERIVSWFRAA